MKKCTICKEIKTIDSFNNKVASKDGKQPACRDCSHARFKAYYQVNKEKQITQIKIRNAKHVAILRDWIVSYLTTHPCADCGNTDIRVLEFDHLPQFKKHRDVTKMVQNANSLQRVIEEVNKCEIRCRNCHAIKTYERMGGSWHDKYIKLGSLV